MSFWINLISALVLIVGVTITMFVIVYSSEEKWTAFKQTCTETHQGYAEWPRGGYMQCWNTKAGTRIFW